MRICRIRASPLFSPLPSPSLPSPFLFPPLSLNRWHLKYPMSFYPSTVPFSIPFTSRWEADQWQKLAVCTWVQWCVGALHCPVVPSVWLPVRSRESADTCACMRVSLLVESRWDSLCLTLLHWASVFSCGVKNAASNSSDDGDLYVCCTSPLEMVLR